MRRPIVECVANFSEGRDESVVNSIAESISLGLGAALLHRTMDPDHNRCVLTFAGSPEAVSAAAVRAVAKAAELIDLTRHRGVHPRLGAADVIPFVPVQGVTLENCVELARRTGEEIWRTCGVPVYFYEAAASRRDRTHLEDVRRGGFEGVREAVRYDEARRPDLGGPELHPTAGAAIVGARRFLIAWNVNLATADVEVAKTIARRIRASNGGFAHLKALGLMLESRGQAQVSMNLTDHVQTPMHVVFSEIQRQAAELGTTVAGTEVIGLIPGSALEQAAGFWMQFENFRPDIVLERRIEEALPFGLEDILGQLSDPAGGDGGGSAAAIAAALAASLAMLVCRLAKADSRIFEEHRSFFAGVAVRGAYAPFLIAERAAALTGDLERLIATSPALYAADAQAALDLASAARKALDARLRAIPWNQ